MEFQHGLHPSVEARRFHGSPFLVAAKDRLEFAVTGVDDRGYGRGRGQSGVRWVAAVAVVAGSGRGGHGGWAVIEEEEEAAVAFHAKTLRDHHADPVSAAAEEVGSDHGGQNWEPTVDPG